MAKSSSAERYRLRDGFLAVRNMLLDERYLDRLDRSLGYWALPADRRLPVALMDRTLRDIVSTPFERLAATPGIGQRKLSSLIVLMRRATEELPGEREPLGGASAAEGAAADPLQDDHLPLDPALVSETVWEQWCATVRLHHLGGERLGRLAPSLQDLPTVIWFTPLSDYMGRSLGEIRQLKTHGEKRVRVVLEVFRTIHQVLGRIGRHPGLAVRLSPAFVPALEEWLTQEWARGGPIELGELRQNLVLPLVNQLAVDAGPLIQKLAEGRLGIEGPPDSVRRLAQRVGVTRARVYQLLETCERVMEVRWPEGRARFQLLEQQCDQGQADAEARAMLRALRDLIFPTKAVAVLESEEDATAELLGARDDSVEYSTLGAKS